MREPGIAFTSPQTPLIAAPIGYLEAHQEPPGALCLAWSFSTEEKHALLQIHCCSQAAKRTLPTSLAPDSQRWIICSRIADNFGHLLLDPHEVRGSGLKPRESSSTGSAPPHWGSDPLQPLLLLKEVNSRLYEKAAVNRGARARFDGQRLAGSELSASTHCPSPRHCSGQLGREHQMCRGLIKRGASQLLVAWGASVWHRNTSKRLYYIR